MTSTLAVRPCPGRRVRHPDGRVLEARGEAVEDGPYWRRRLGCGDVEPVPVEPERPAPKPREKPAAREAKD